MTPNPAERIDLDELVIRRETDADAEDVACAIASNLPRLATWMPWATDDAGTTNTQRTRIADATAQWNTGSVYDYVVTDTAGVVLGKAGLHRRSDDAVELGYWLTAPAEGRGIMTRVASALTDVALRTEGIERVEIHCDEANERSHAVPRRLGYRLDRTEDHPVTTPGQTGRQMIWIASSAGNVGSQE